MGSRAARARKGQPPRERATQTTPLSPPTSQTQTFDGMPVPVLSDVDTVFGCTKHLPPYASIPDRFKKRYDPYAEFVSGWFFGGRTQQDMQRLRARPGVDRNHALRAIKAVLCSFQPSHEHKEAGCAFLLHEWFELTS